MTRNRRSFPSAAPGIEVVETDDGSRTLRFADRPVSWHSESGALRESQLVYLENSGVAERLAAGIATTVFEVGFGTGLNFWLTASAAIRHKTPLGYTAVEPNLIDFTTFSELGYDRLPGCREAIATFAQPIFSGGDQQTTRNINTQFASITVAQNTLQSWLKTNHQSFDAIYFDPFDPDEASSLWQPDILASLFRRTKPGGRLVTYCVKSQIQKMISESGFEVSKTPGPINGKREVLVARKKSD